LERVDKISAFTSTPTACDVHVTRPRVMLGDKWWKTSHHLGVPKVIAECWLLTLIDGHVAVLDGSGEDFSPTWWIEVPDQESPQEVIARTAPVTLFGAPHSTSWRYRDGEIVLSFVAIPVHRPESGTIVPLHTSKIGRAKSDITYQQVVQHAARHVAFLFATDPAFDAPDRPEWLIASREHVPTVFQDLTSASGR
jgi:hypothetical protein